jgi:hypothetical protein
MTQAPQAFRIDVPQEALDDLLLRLRRTRFARPRALHPELVAVRTDPRFPHPTAPGWEAGVDPDYLRSLVEYWADEFDWRAAEARLNDYPQYLADGMHVVHIRRDPGRPPVLLTHGWPSTFLELLPLADLLDTDVVVPSLPGYLWSQPLEGPATREAIGERLHALMTEAWATSATSRSAATSGARPAAGPPRCIRMPSPVCTSSTAPSPVATTRP